jgi:hypothetical protein
MQWRMMCLEFSGERRMSMWPPVSEARSEGTMQGVQGWFLYPDFGPHFVSLILTQIGARNKSLVRVFTIVT